jgi:hypothetical protein
MTDLRAIQVRVGYSDGADDPFTDPNHVLIELAPANWKAYDREECTAREWWLALIDIAGILGRVALAMSTDIAASAHQHQCVRVFAWSSTTEPLRGPDLTGCPISGDPQEVLQPGRDLGSSPAPYMQVPLKELNRYLDRIRELLEAIADDANQLDAFDPFEPHDNNTLTTAATGHAQTSTLAGAPIVGTLEPDSTSPTSPSPHTPTNKSGTGSFKWPTGPGRCPGLRLPHRDARTRRWM